jgi:hypothetical protein
VIAVPEPDGLGTPRDVVAWIVSGYDVVDDAERGRRLGMGAYEQAFQKLHQTRLDEFVAARKRLAAELRAKGDAAGAAELAKRRRPTASAWTVNQLYWRSRDAFDEMVAAAGRVRRGDLGATGAYREAIATLRKGAEGILKGDGHGVTEAVLRRVTATLAAVAVNGFDPDAPGTLVADRDPPGFEAAGTGGARRAEAREREPARRDERAAKRTGTRTSRKDEVGAARAARAAAAERARRAAEQAEQKRRRAEDARRKAERRRVEARLRAARGDVDRRERTLASRRKEVQAAEQALDAAREVVQDLERRLRELADA